MRLQLWVLDKNGILDLTNGMETILQLKYCLDNQTFMHMYHFTYIYLRGPPNNFIYHVVRNAVLLQSDLGVLRVSSSSVIPGVWDLSWTMCCVISKSGPVSFLVDAF